MDRPNNDNQYSANNGFNGVGKANQSASMNSNYSHENPRVINFQANNYEGAQNANSYNQNSNNHNNFNRNQNLNNGFNNQNRNQNPNNNQGFANSQFNGQNNGFNSQKSNNNGNQNQNRNNQNNNQNRNNNANQQNQNRNYNGGFNQNHNNNSRPMGAQQNNQFGGARQQNNGAFQARQNGYKGNNRPQRENGQANNNMSGMSETNGGNNFSGGNGNNFNSHSERNNNFNNQNNNLNFQNQNANESLFNKGNQVNYKEQYEVNSKMEFSHINSNQGFNEQTPTSSNVNDEHSFSIHTQKQSDSTLNQEQSNSHDSGFAINNNKQEPTATSISNVQPEIKQQNSTENEENSFSIGSMNNHKAEAPVVFEPETKTDAFAQNNEQQSAYSEQNKPQQANQSEQIATSVNFAKTNEIKADTSNEVQPSVSAQKPETEKYEMPFAQNVFGTAESDQPTTERPFVMRMEKPIIQNETSNLGMDGTNDVQSNQSTTSELEFANLFESATPVQQSTSDSSSTAENENSQKIKKEKPVKIKKEKPVKVKKEKPVKVKAEKPVKVISKIEYSKEIAPNKRPLGFGKMFINQFFLLLPIIGIFYSIILSLFARKANKNLINLGRTAFFWHIVACVLFGLFFYYGGVGYILQWIFDLLNISAIIF